MEREHVGLGEQIESAMSFLEHDDDASAVVADALAFLDEFEFGASEGSAKVDARVNDSGCLATSDTTALQSAKVKKRRRNPMIDIRRRERKKRERELLLREREELELRLGELRKLERSENSGSRDDGRMLVCQQSSLDLAVKASIERKKAEELNGVLKKQMAKQLKEISDIRRVLCRHIDRQQEPVRLIEPIQRPVQPAVAFGATIIDEVRAIVRALHSTTDAVFKSPLPPSSGAASSFARVFTEVEGGAPGIELVTETRLTCDHERATSILTEWMGTKKPVIETVLHSFKQRRFLEHSIELQYEVELCDPAEPVTIPGVSVMQQFKQPNRVVNVWASTLLDPSGRGRFLECGWLLLGPLESGGSVLRSCYRVSTPVKQPSGSLDEGNDVDEFQSRALKLLSGHMKVRQLEFQSALLRQTGQPQAARLLLATA